MVSSIFCAGIDCKSLGEIYAIEAGISLIGKIVFVAVTTTSSV